MAPGQRHELTDCPALLRPSTPAIMPPERVQVGSAARVGPRCCSTPCARARPASTHASTAHRSRALMIPGSWVRAPPPHRFWPAVSFTRTEPPTPTRPSGGHTGVGHRRTLRPRHQRGGRLGGLALHVLEHARVDVLGDRRAGVAQHLAGQLQVPDRRVGQAGGQVPRVRAVAPAGGRPGPRAGRTAARRRGEPTRADDVRGLDRRDDLSGLGQSGGAAPAGWTPAGLPGPM